MSPNFGGPKTPGEGYAGALVKTRGGGGQTEVEDSRRDQSWDGTTGKDLGFYNWQQSSLRGLKVRVRSLVSRFGIKSGFSSDSG